MLMLAMAPAAASACLAKNVLYDNGASGPLYADLYGPATPPPPGGYPAVLLIHGGGWAAGDKSWYQNYGPSFANQGYLAMAINYPLAMANDPSTTWPAQANAVDAAVAFLRANAAQCNVNAAMIAAVGESAGGHLAAWQGSLDSALPNRVGAVVAFAAPWDLTVEQPQAPGSTCGVNDDFSTCAAECKALVPGNACIYNLLGTGNLVARTSASPFHRIGMQSAPTLLIHGTVDSIVPCGQSKKVENKLLAVPRPVFHAYLAAQGHPDLAHGFPNPPSLWLEPTFQFLNWWRGGPPPSNAGTCNPQ
ncbi:MAG TPA: alpha/beta hydrolase [Burkholderiaceae bacterium]